MARTAQAPRPSPRTLARAGHAPNRIKFLLRTAPMSMSDLATRSGFSVWHLSRIANRHQAPSGLARLLISRALDRPQREVFPNHPAVTEDEV